MKIVSMERSEADKAVAKARMEVQMEDQGPDYPWGLCINLGTEELQKLGIVGLPEIGDEFHIMAIAKVTNVHQSASEGGDDCRGVTLQITDMGTMSEEKEDPAEKFSKSAAALYGKKD